LKNARDLRKQAFDLSQEDPRTLARYDTSCLFDKSDRAGGAGHWKDITPLEFAGGGPQMSQSIGQTNRTASRGLLTGQFASRRAKRAACRRQVNVKK